MTERLLDYDTSPRFVTVVGQTSALEVLKNNGEQTWGDGQIEGMVPTRAPFAIELANGLSQAVVGISIAQVTGDEPDSFGHLLPRVFIEGSARVLPD